MELEGLKRGLAVVKNADVTISTLVTDRHSGIKKYIRENEQSIDHRFDCWHLSTSMKQLCKFIYILCLNNVIAFDKQIELFACLTEQMYQRRLRHLPKRKVALFWEAGSRALPITCTGVLRAVAVMENKSKPSGCRSLTMWLMYMMGVLQISLSVLMVL